MNDWYTYTLRHPSGLVFYVGKGQGNSWNAHEQKAKRGEQVKLTTIIQEIWSQGQQVQKQKEREHLSAEEAYAHQVEMYSKYSAENPEMQGHGTYPRAIEHGKSIGASRKAKGFTFSKETRAKMSEKRKGTTQSDAAKQKHREAYQYDRINSPEAIAKRDAKRTGAKRTDEARAKMSIAAKNRIACMSEEAKATYFDNWIEAGQVASKRTTKDSSIELMVEETLKASGIVYEKQYRVGIYTADFYVPATNTIIEVNGCWIHRCQQCGWNNHGAEEIRTKDARKLACLESKGYTVNVIWEHSIDGHKIRMPKK